MRNPAVVLTVLIAFLVLGCPASLPPPNPPPTPTARKADPVGWSRSKSGLGFRLSESGTGDERAPAAAKTTPLSDADAKKVIDRLPPLKAEPDDEKDFALRDRSRPPPRTGKTIVDAFPPPVAAPSLPPIVAGVPPTVMRKAPVGAVELAPYLSVSFSQPMVAVTSHDDLARTAPPVNLTPLPPGKWRWVGSQTVIFDPEKRFPMATEYAVEVPAGTRAANGQALAATEKWTFSTPPPKLVSSYPQGGPTGLEPVLYAEFDQAVDTQALLGAVEVKAGATAVDVRVASEAEIEADASVRQMSAKAQAGRWIALKAKSPLPTGTTFTVRFPVGTPSAEGPKRTLKEQSFGFRTYDKLHMDRANCGWGACAPGSAWSIHFNNELDTKKFDRAWVTVSPEPASMKVGATGRTIDVRSRSRGKTTYTITVSKALTDIYGQTLGKDATAQIKVDPAEPMLFAEEARMSVLDPSLPTGKGGPALPVFSVNRPSLNVKLYAVEPADYLAYEKWRSDWDSGQKETAPPGRLVASRTVKPENKADELVMTPVDLGAALKAGLGHVIVIVEVPGPHGNRWERVWLRTWVQVTRIGLDAFVDDDSIVGWATRLADGAPLEGVEIGISQSGTHASTGADGLARMRRTGAQPNTEHTIYATKGADTAILPAGYGDGNDGSHRPDMRWLLFDDRHIYKPGEEVHVKGWLRLIGREKGGDVTAIPAAASQTVTWTARDGRNVELGKGSAPIDASGGFDVSLTLPGTPNLGRAWFTFTVDDQNATHGFEIQEFRRPEFEVNARAGEGPFYVGGHTDVAVAATYYAGGGLPNAEVAWRVTRSEARFVPPNRGDFAFGKASESWWQDRRRGHGTGVETWKGRTGSSGEHRVRVDFDAVEPAYPMSLGFEATVTDVNRQAWAAHTDVLVHPADVYVGVRQERTFAKAGEALNVDVLVTDIDGKAVAGRAVTVKTARIDWELRNGEYVEVEADVDTCRATSTAETARCVLKTKEGGRYRLTAVVTDSMGRKSQTETHVWVIGDSAPPDATLAPGVVEVIPSKTSYAAGETAELLLIAPFAPAEGVLTVRRQGTVLVQRFRLTEATGTVRFPVDAAWVPNVTASVKIVGAASRENARGEPDASLPKRPAFATGSAALKVPPVDRALHVVAKPRDAKLEPGGHTMVDVEVRDAAGAAAAGSTAAIIVVDEAILALSAYQTPDPLAFFYTDRSANTADLALRSYVLLARDDDKRLSVKEAPGAGGLAKSFGVAGAKPMMMMGSSPMAPPVASAAPGSNSAPQPKITLRSDFSALARFAAAVKTDANGRASVDVKLPDNLTRYRVMAIAVAGERQFGSVESSITARLPLMVRPSAPRFLNYGDRFELPIVLQNQTDADLVVDVAARAGNALLTDGAGRRVTVPANDRVEVRLPAAAARPGKARFQIGASSGRWSDAAEVELPVWTPATTEAFATYGTLDNGAIAQPVKMPSAVAPQFGGIEITTSSTAVSALTDALLYLVRYPYECNEQLASRVMAVAALRDVLTAFKAPGMPASDVLIASMKADIEKLRSRQQWSGGWSFWGSEHEPWPYLSIHVTHALQRALDKGYAVPPETMAKAKGYLRAIEQHIPSYYSAESRRALVAYALYVRKRIGDADPTRARKLITESGGVEKMQLDALGWLWPTLLDDASSSVEADNIRKLVQNRVSETAGAAHFTTSYDDGEYVLLHSDRGADAILLEALIGDQEKQPSAGGHDLIPKLVTGLLAHRTAGHWSSTQENAFVLLALDRYFAVYEKATPDFVARAWLGDRYAGEHAFKGRSTDRQEVDIPMGALADIGSANVVVSKDGPGRLYYRIGMTYAPSDLRPPPSDHGFTVSRLYEAVDDPGDVKRDPDGTWRVKNGTKVRVRVSMVAPARRYHVALVDPLPAGLEVMNPALAVTGGVPQDPKAEPDSGVPWWWLRTWYEHQNMRDERVEAFASLLWEGVYDYTYVARATTPGAFVVPPPKAEEMYSPETFGRGAGDRMVVE